MNEFITNLLISLVYTRHKNITDLLKSNDYEYIISAIKDRDYATKERILEVLISSSYILNKSKKLEYFLNDALNTNRNLLYQGILKDELFLKNLLKNFYTLIDIRDNNLIEFRQKEYEALNDANTPLFKLNYQCFEKFYSLNDLLRRMLLETYNLAIKNGAAKDIAITYFRGMIVEGIDFF